LLFGKVRRALQVRVSQDRLEFLGVLLNGGKASVKLLVREDSRDGIDVGIAKENVPELGEQSVL
jgi:hypothetical protein